MYTMLTKLYHPHLFTFFDTDLFVSKSPEMSYSPNTATSDARNPGWQWAGVENDKRWDEQKSKLQFSENVYQVSTKTTTTMMLMVNIKMGGKDIKWISLFYKTYLLWARKSWKLKLHRIYSLWKDPAMYFHEPKPAKETRLLRH